MDESPETILKRLEQLRCWQTEQQQKLISKQLSRSELCAMEQRKLFEMFGFSTSTVSNSSDIQQRSNECNMVLNDLSDEDTVNIPISAPILVSKRSPVATPIHNFSLKELESYGKGSNIQSNVDAQEKPKQRFLKRGQGLAARFKIHPEKLRIDNLPKYKFANSHKKSKFLRDENRFGEAAKVKQFTGELKLTRTDSADRVVKAVSAEQFDVQNDLPKSTSMDEQHNTPPLTTRNLPPLTTWSNALEYEPANVVTKSKINHNSILSTPTMEEKVDKQRQDQRDLQIFELLEQNLNNSGLSRDSNILQELVKYISSVSNLKPTQSLKPQQKINFNKIEDNDVQMIKTVKRNVRFSDERLTDDNDVDSECETLASTDIDDLDLSKTSTPITKTAFELFKQNLFADRIDKDSTLVEQRSLKDNSMQLRNEELKQRLIELQTEIELFRQQNAVLTSSMREHEMEKLQWEESKTEMMEKLEDERMRQEVYLHDERMKLADEQKKLDKRAKELRAPNRKDREEVAKLKQEIADLQRESINKDQKHVSAQARLRAQIRNMEKDLKEFSMEIDNLRKENKKIESENMRLRRQNNNKMLNEINKNIAKLAPKTETENLNKGTNPATATTSNQGDHQMKTRSKSVPNLIEVKEISKAYESDSESDCSSSSSAPAPDNQRSTYFKSIQTKSKSPANNENIVQQIDQIPTSESNDVLNLKREIENDDGSRDIWYPNGNLKKISADDMVIRMLYFNKDIKETNIHEGTVKYYYGEANTWQTTYLDGLEIWEFPDGKTEHHYKDGGIEIHHPDGSICITNPNNMEIAEEWKYVNGTTIVIKRNGDKYLNLPNGQREVTTKNHIRREYPDGTVKIKYPDGSLETRYSNGRIRIRDAAGTLVRDSENQ